MRVHWCVPPSSGWINGYSIKSLKFIEWVSGTEVKLSERHCKHDQLSFKKTSYFRTLYTQWPQDGATHTHTNKTGSNAIIIYQPSTCLPVYYNQIHSYVTSNCIQRNSIQVSIKTTLLIHIDYRNVKKRILVQISYYRTITIYETFFWWKHYMFMCHTLSVIQRTQHLGLKVSPETSNRLIF